MVGLALVLCLPLWGQEQARFALIIGNANYDGAAKLANPINDATDIAAILRTIGWKTTLLIDADRRTMNRSLSDFRDQLFGSKGSAALVYYAGHGVQINGQNYLIPVKETFERADDVISDAINMQNLVDVFDQGEAAATIVILDACRDNPFARKSSRSLPASRGLGVIAQATAASGSATIFAAAPGQTAQDGSGRNGVFTTVLLRYLTQDMKLQDMVTKVTGDVKRMTGGAQVPYNSMSFTDDFYLKPESMRAAPTPVPAVLPATQKTTQSASTGTGDIALLPTLVSRREVAKAKATSSSQLQRWVPWVDLGGWAVAAAGAALTGYAWFAADQAYTKYSGASTVADLSAAHSQIDSMNLLFKVGIGTIVGGGALGIGFLFPDANPAPWTKMVEDLDRQIAVLQAEGSTK